MNTINNDIKKNLNMPIIVIEGYLAFTVFLYAFGPWEWKTNNPILTYMMLFAFQVALALGYKTGIRKKSINLISIDYIEAERKKYSRTIFSNKFLQILLILNLIFIMLNIVRTLDLASFSLSSILNQVTIGLTNPAAQYKLSQIVVTKFGGSILSYANVLLAPLLWLAIPLSIYRFKELSIVFKSISVITIFLEIARWVATGTNKGFFDIVIIVLAVIFVKKLTPFQSRKKRLYSKSIRKNNIKITIVALIFLFICVWFFSNAIGDRVQMNWTNLEISTGNTQINFDSILMRLCPSYLKATLIYVSSYLTQGYYALSLATLVEWTPMFGVGNSMFLMDNLSSIFNTDLYQFTYQTKLIQYGWDSFVNWHSFYIWVANDVSIIGVVFVMYILGRFLANVVYDATIIGDNIAVGIFCLLAVLFLYMPANNQLLSYPTTFMAFWVLTGIWAFKKKIRLRFK